MKTVYLILFLFINCLFSATAQYITTDLTGDTYITYKGYDWTWASAVSATNVSAINPATGIWETNVLQDPTVHEGWMFIEDSELITLFEELTIDNFTVDGEIIQSTKHWNSSFYHVDADFFDSRTGVKYTDISAVRYFDIFYVRKAQDSGSGNTNININQTSVPEPTSLILLVMGLLLMRKRNIPN